MSKPHDKVPDWLVERLAAGELTPGTALSVKARLQQAEGGAASRMAELERSDAEILAAHPPDLVAAEIRRRLAVAPREAPATARPRRGLLMVFIPTLALGGAAALGLVTMAPGSRVAGEGPVGTGAGDPAERTTVKGLKPHLVVYRKQFAGSSRLGNGSQVRPGDNLQVAYVSGGRRFGVIASVDARGVVTLHLPGKSGPAAPLAGAGETRLPDAYELDDSPAFERFVLITGNAPFDTSAAVQLLRSQGKPNPLPPDLEVFDLLLRKSPR